MEGRLIAIVVWCAGIAGCAALGWLEPHYHTRHPAVVASAAVTVAWMIFGWAGMVLGLVVTRVAWTLGWIMLLIHFAIAFGVAHAWSHAAAVDHVRAVGGFGAGIAVNYAFALVWGADVIWWWCNPNSRANRARWVTVTIHGSLLFVVVNATIVFGPPGRRWAYTAGLVVLAVMWLWNRNRK